MGCQSRGRGETLLRRSGLESFIMNLGGPGSKAENAKKKGPA